MTVLKKDLMIAKKNFQDSLEVLEKLMTDSEIKSIMIKDNQWNESCNSIIESFLPRSGAFLKKVNKIIEVLPSGRGRKRKF